MSGGCARAVAAARAARGQVPEKQVVTWLMQLALALQYIHERNIIHRDLKTQNIFLMGDDSLKLGDFGVSRVLDSPVELAKTCAGGPPPCGRGTRAPPLPEARVPRQQPLPIPKSTAPA